MKRHTNAPPRLWPQLALTGLFGVASLCFLGLRNNAAAMDTLYQGFTAPFHQLMGWLTGLVPFSVAEPFVLLFVLYCLFFICKAVCDFIRTPKYRLRILCKKILSTCVLCLAVYTGFSFLWGVCYYSTPIQQKLGLTVGPVAVPTLTATTAYYATLVNTHAPTVSRNSLGQINSSPAALLASSATLYQPLEKKYPFLQRGTGQAAKPLFLAEGMRYLNYAGIFFPFTGEANVNSQAPLSFLPSTIAHELAHVRGVGPEQTANFVAILACAESTLPAYTYSGALLGYTHLANALYTADHTAWQAISNTLCPQTRADLQQSNAYWQAYANTPVSQAADTVYENFLQGYNQTLGLKSYGAVVDLLVAYHNL